MNGIEGTQGFIVDWSAGTVKRPKDARRFEIAFYVDGWGSAKADQLVYVVSYAVDALTAQGYVYLPGRGDPHYSVNVRSIYRGPAYEGHWWRATSTWQDVMRTFALSSTAPGPLPVGQRQPDRAAALSNRAGGHHRNPLLN